MKFFLQLYAPAQALLFFIFFTTGVYAAPPTDITLTPTTVSENQPVNTQVGTFTTTDPDIGNTFTYTLVPGTGDDNNGSFNISGDKLRTSEIFNYEVKSSYSIRVQTFDGTSTYQKIFTITILNVNDRPDLDNIEASVLSYTEGDAATIITSTLTVTDEDNNNPDSARVYFSDGYVSTEDVLSLSPGLFTITFATDSGILTFKNSTRSISLYQSALRSVRYSNTNAANPSTADREVSFVVFDDGLRSDTLSRTIEITAVNDAPVLSGIEVTTLPYTENDAATIITGTIQVTDGDDTNIESATVQITSGYQNGQDVLSFPNANGITGTWSAVTGTMSLSGTSSVANYRLALRSIRYENTSENPSTVARVISFTVNDGNINSNTVTRNLSVAEENDAPVLSGIEGTDLPYTEGDPATIITSSVSVSDVDNTNLISATVRINSGLVSAEDVLSLTGTTFTVSYTAATGILSISGSGTLAAYQNALRNVRYQNTNVVNPSLVARTVTFTVNDGTTNSNTVSRNIVFTGINSPPVLSGIETSTRTYTENAAPIQITTAILVADDDDTNIESATVVISSGYQNNEDILSFTNANGISGTWIPATGTLSLTGSATLANYQTALRNVRYANSNDNPNTLVIRVISFTVNDGNDNSNTVSRNLTVTPVNDAPVLSGIETSALPYTEGDTTTIISSTIVVKDTDNVNLSSATVRITSGLASAEDVLSLIGTSFTVNYTPATGTLLILGLNTVASYQSALRNVKYQNTNKDDPSLTTRTVTFTVNDGSLNSNTVSRNITLTGVNDPPVASNATITGLHNPFRTRELLTAHYTYTDPDNDPEQGTTFKWFTATNSSGAGRAQVSGADKDTLTPQFADGGKYISMVVIPRDNKGLWGDDDTSSWYYINAAPEFTDLDIDGTLAVGETVSAVFNYYDLESNPADEDGHEFQWYGSETASWSGAIAITGEDELTYVIREEDYENFIAFEAYPHATQGSSPGQRVRSEWYSVGELPSAHISGRDTICSPGMDAELKVTFTGENSPWTIKYTINGSNETEITDITETEYTLYVTQVGTYVLTEVSDTKYDNGNISGTGYVLLYPSTTAAFTSENSCEEINNHINIALTGTKPWTVSYRYESESPVAISDITQSQITVPVENTGLYTLISVSDKKCTGTVGGPHEIIPAPAVAIGGLRSNTYALDSPTDTLDISPFGGNFDESDYSYAILPQAGMWVFHPSIAYSYGSPFWIRYAYQDPATTCIGKDSIRVFIIRDAAEIQIENEKTLYCSNDDIIELNGVNIFNNYGTFSIQNNIGLIDSGENTAWVIPSLIQHGYRTVTYEVEIDGVMQSDQKLLYFGHVEADFSWDNECFDNNHALVNFSDSSEASEEGMIFDTYLWSFYFPEDTVYRNTAETSIDFTSLQTYDAELMVSTLYNDEDRCYDTVRKPVSLKPTTTIGSNYMPYDEDFSNGVGYWSTFAMDGNNHIVENGYNTWDFGSPVEGGFTANQNEIAWFTNIENYNEAENSYVISPCFNFTNATRPMIKMDIWRDFWTEEDGAVLQYTDDNGLHWDEIGAENDGSINWYNSHNIDGNPGNQGEGWERLDGEISDFGWVEARHKLDNLKGKTNVRFRVAYGAPEGIGNSHKGIAFDDFWVGERTKKVLIEHFTNSNEQNCVSIDEQFNTFMNNSSNRLDIIDIQYHTDFPEPDTFYTLSPGPNYSREYYYGISSVPYGVIDGSRGNDANYIIDYSVEGEDGLTQNILTEAALDDNEFDITMQVVKGSNSLGIDVELEANENLSQRYLTLHVAIVENVITGITGDNGQTQFESVLKAMLPDAGGTAINKSWETDETQSWSFDYHYQHVFNERELQVIAFVQDEDSHTIYQAQSISPFNITGTDPLTDESRANFIIYPNPATFGAFVRIYNYGAGELTMEVINSEGRVIYNQIVKQDEEIVPINLNSYQAGLYFIRLISDKEIIGTQRLTYLGNK